MDILLTVNSTKKHNDVCSWHNGEDQLRANQPLHQQSGSCLLVLLHVTVCDCSADGTDNI
jgi:hypothetical protein